MKYFEKEAGFITNLFKRTKKGKEVTQALVKQGPREVATIPSKTTRKKFIPNKLGVGVAAGATGLGIGLLED